jgi:hypothetical protein
MRRSVGKCAEGINDRHEVLDGEASVLAALEPADIALLGS